MHSLKTQYFVIAWAMLATPLAVAASLAAGSPYNVVTFGNFQASNIDTGGSMAIGGNMNVSGYNIAQNPINPASFAASSYALVLSGTFSGSTSVASGSVWLGNALTAGNNIFLNGSGSPTTTVGGTSPFNFAAAQAALTAQSNYLAQQSANGFLSVAFGTVNIGKATDPAGTYYVTLTADQLALANSININFSAGSTMVINVVGCASSGSTCISFPNGGFSVNGSGANGDSTNSAVKNVLFNFSSATTIAFNGSALGSILAPKAVVSATSNVQLDGQLLALSFLGRAPGASTGGNVEFHNFLFAGNIPNPTPEPATFGATAMGLAALVVWSRKRRQT